MTKNQNNDQVGDTQMPALGPHAAGLHDVGDSATRVGAELAPKSSKIVPIADVATASKAKGNVCIQSCNQTLWFSFFFDGTGNNLEADVGTLKHSNVAKLFRVHVADDKTNGTYRLYIPGLGTYFQAVGDPGGTDLGLGAGKFGEARLDWALARFDELLRPHVRRATNTSNRIVEINLSAFGFSRGAALARAFINIFLEKRCEVTRGSSDWRLKAGGFPIRIRFMGLFDTVASVGTPMSLNNTSLVGAAASNVAFCIRYRLSDQSLANVVPARLAFSKGALPGADPAIGPYDGHSSWGKLMRIPQMVEEVRHFVAAHEMRNSFPLDSISVLDHQEFLRPAHFHETVYPGVHSDVGGSYRPGEGGRGSAATQKMGLIPLAHMFEHAIAKGVPLKPRSAWEPWQENDFAIQREVQDSYNYYIKKMGAISSLGMLFNAHMALYFSWRFRAIRRRGEGEMSELSQIERSKQTFQAEIRRQKPEVAILEKESDTARKAVENLRERRRNLSSRGFVAPGRSDAIQKIDSALRNAEAVHEETQDRFLRAKAKLDAIPDMNSFSAMLTLYDQQLLSDVREIHKILSFAENLKSGVRSKRAELRPHYRALIAAYENEFIYKTGLNDEKIIDFFDTYVHDSLAGFAKDATLPSDPRVVYVGCDEKLKFALVEAAGNSANTV